MKNLKLVLSLTLLLTFLSVVRCTKTSDPAPLVGISGTVTYTDASGAVQKAAGAVVYLAKGTAATTTYDQSTTAGSDGTYNFANLPAAGYYINAVYHSDTKNSAARIDGVKFTTANGFLVTLASTALTQDIALESTGSAAAAVNVTVAYQWDPAASSGAGNYTNTGAWTFDNIHSPVQFNFPYHGAEAEFAASFVQTKSFQMTFNSASLSTSSIVAIVDLASINTGTPGGRDNQPTTITSTNEFAPGTFFTKLGCIMGTFGITADAGTVTPNITLSSDKRYATFTSTSIKAYGDGYVANGTLTFHGFTKSVSMIFHYLPSYVDTSVTPNKTYQGFEGKISIKALTDFGISSTSVGDLVTIYTTVNLYK
jgi:polyisoprenoid-binding protein YceI